MPKLSLCMIVRDEEENLRQCLDSVHSHVDEIIIVDTGSEDRTREIATSYGASIFQFDPSNHPEAFFRDTAEENAQWGGPGEYSGMWCLSDFGAARAESFRRASGDFMVWVDADDVVIDGQEFRTIVDSMERDKHSIAFLPYHYQTDDQGRVYYRQWRERIIRRGAAEWINPVHEVLLAKIPPGPQPRFEKPLYDHRRKANRKQVPHRNYKILLRQAWQLKTANPSAPLDPRILFYLGQEARWVDPRRSVGYFEEYLHSSGWPEERAAAHCAIGQMLELNTLPLPKEQIFSQAQREYATAAAEQPDNPDGIFGLARIAYYRGRFADCCNYTERGLKIGNTDTMLGTNPMERLYRPHAYYNDSLAKLGRVEEAIASCEAALKIAPDDPGVPYGSPGAIKSNLAAFQQELVRRAGGPKPNERAVVEFSKNEDVEAPPAAGIPRDALVIWSIQLWKQLIAAGDFQQALHFLAVLPENVKIDPVYARLAAATERRISGVTHLPRESPIDHIPRRMDPAPGSLSIVFFIGAGPESWDPTTPNKVGLGGSETAAIEMARNLASMGHSVEVVAEAEGEFDRVRYTSHARYRGSDCDVFISSRLAWAADQYPIKARVKLLWVHDINVGDRTPGMERWLYSYDRILCLSQWHRDFFLSCYPTLHPDRVVVTRNGIDPSRFLDGHQPENVKRIKMPPKRNHLVWSSSPNRGLDLLLRNFPIIRSRVPDAELHIYYGFDTWEAFARARGSREELANIELFKAALPPIGQSRDGVFNHGKSSQKELAAAFMRAKVWPYLSQFTETSCISAMEAMAAGCLPVGSACGALPETVGSKGYLFPNDDPQTPQKWFEKVVDVLLNHEAHAGLALSARENALRTLDWKSVALKWHGMFRELIAGSNEAPAWNRGAA